MKLTTPEFNKAFIKYIDTKRELINENVPSYIKMNSEYFDTFLRELHKTGKFNDLTFTSEECYIKISFLDGRYDAPIVFDNEVETYEKIFS